MNIRGLPYLLLGIALGLGFAACDTSTMASSDAGHIHFTEYDQDPLGGTQFLVYCDKARHNLIYMTDFNRATSKSPGIAVVSGGC
jgi:hypothetical protein